MSEFRDQLPKSPAAMYDRLHQWFGIGDWDEAIDSKPWHHTRMVEIGKLKRMLKSRRASLAEVYIAAEYAHRTGQPIRHTWQVFALIPEAMRERFRVAMRTRVDAAAEDLDDAIQEALDLGEHGWAERLMRAGDHEKAIADWRSR